MGLTLAESLKGWIAGLAAVHPMLVDYEDKRIRRHAIVVSTNGDPVPILLRRKMKLFYCWPWVRKLLHLRPVPPTASAYFGRARRLMRRARLQRPVCQSQYQRYLRVMMANLRTWHRDTEDAKGVVVFIHGGNRWPREILDTGIEVCNRIKNSGWYPIFICWDASLPHAYFQQRWHIRSGVYKPRRFWTWPPVLLFLEDLLTGVGRSLTVLLLYAKLVWHSSRWHIPQTPSHPYRLEMRPDGRYTMEGLSRLRTPSVQTGSWKPGLPLHRLALMIAGFWLQLFALFLGASFFQVAWQNLLRHTRSMFRAPREFDPVLADGEPLPDGSRFSPPAGAMAQFMDELARTLKDPSSGLGGLQVRIITQSMGSMVANEALRCWSDLPYESLVYLVPACSVRDFNEAVDPVIRKRSGKAQAYVVTLHPKVEAGMHWCGGLLVGSVLEWLDELLAPPNTYLDRMLGRWENAIRTCHIYDDKVRHGIHFKCVSYDGRTLTMPYDHDHFFDPKWPFWDEDNWGPVVPLQASSVP